MGLPYKPWMLSAMAPQGELRADEYSAITQRQAAAMRNAVALQRLEEDRLAREEKSGMERERLSMLADKYRADEGWREREAKVAKDRWEQEFGAAERARQAVRDREAEVKRRENEPVMLSQTPAETLEQKDALRFMLRSTLGMAADPSGGLGSEFAPPEVGIDEIVGTVSPKLTRQIEEAREPLPRWRADIERKKREERSRRQMIVRESDERRKERIGEREERAQAIRDRHRKEQDIRSRNEADIREKKAKEEEFNRRMEKRLGKDTWNDLKIEGELTQKLADKGLSPERIVEALAESGLGPKAQEVWQWTTATPQDRRVAVRRYMESEETSGEHVVLLKSIGARLVDADNLLRVEEELSPLAMEEIEAGMRDAVSQFVRTYDPIRMASVMEAIAGVGPDADLLQYILPHANKDVLTDPEDLRRVRRILLRGLGVDYRARKREKGIMEENPWIEDAAWAAAKIFLPGGPALGQTQRLREKIREAGPRSDYVMPDQDPSLPGPGDIYDDPSLDRFAGRYEPGLLVEAIRREIKAGGGPRPDRTPSRRGPGGWRMPPEIPVSGDQVLRQRAAQVLAGLPEAEQGQFRSFFDLMKDNPGAQRAYMRQLIARQGR